MNKIFTLLFISFLNFPFVFPQSNWISRQDFGGMARYGASGFSVGSKGYICMGFDGSVNYNDLWEYNPGSNTWSQKANCQGNARRTAVAFAIDSLGYVGTGYDGSSHYKDFWQYNPNGNSWSQKADFGGSPRYGSIGFAINDKGYIGLGNEGSAAGPFPTDIWEYNPMTDTWTQRQNFSGNGRYSAVGFSIGDNGYITCGVGIDGATYFNDLYLFNPISNSWAQKANFPGIARGYPFAFANEKSGYVGGGHQINVFSDVYCYNASCDIWVQVQNYAGNGGYLSSYFVINGSGYVGTGYDLLNYKNDFWEFRPLCVIEVPAITPDDSMSVCQGDTVTLTSSISANYLWSNGATSQSITVTNPGSYSVSVTDNSSCCSASLPYSVSFSPAPPTPLIQQNNSLLACTESGMSSYEWFLNGNVLPACPTQFCNCEQDGFYSVVITNSNGCSSASALFNASGCSSGIFTESGDIPFLIYPNPANNKIYTSHYFTKAIVYNITGEKILVKETNDLSNVIDIMGLERGMYFVEVCYKQKKKSFKIVICR